MMLLALIILATLLALILVPAFVAGAVFYLVWSFALGVDRETEKGE
jgi:hypothetical protein